jgi:ABC-type thiamine transport system ATPase subunit
MIRIDRITKDYGGVQPAIAELEFNIEPGSVTVMVGTTGSGKSTLIRVLAGLEAPTSGRIRWDEGSNTPFGIVFQEPRLMPWLNVCQNVTFGFGPRRKRESGRLADEILEHVGLRAFSRYYPRQLSGGMAQRVAIARALVKKPLLLPLLRAMKWGSAEEYAVFCDIQALDKEFRRHSVSLLNQSSLQGESPYCLSTIRLVPKTLAIPARRILRKHSCNFLIPYNLHGICHI